MAYIAVTIILMFLCALIFYAIPGFKDISEKREVVEYLHEHEPSFWRVIKEIKDSGSINDLDRAEKYFSPVVERFCNGIRYICTVSNFSEEVSDTYMEKYRNAVSETRSKLDQKHEKSEES